MSSDAIGPPSDTRHLRHSLVYCQHVCAPSAAWQMTRAQVMLRARGVCERCVHQTATQVHHVTYARLGRERLTDLLALCASCHVFITPEYEAAARGDLAARERELCEAIGRAAVRAAEDEYGDREAVRDLLPAGWTLTYHRGWVEVRPWRPE